MVENFKLYRNLIKFDDGDESTHMESSSEDIFFLFNFFPQFISKTKTGIETRIENLTGFQSILLLLRKYVPITRRYVKYSFQFLFCKNIEIKSTPFILICNDKDNGGKKIFYHSAKLLFLF
jgi:hypothetical protein